MGSFIRKTYFTLERTVGCCVERDAMKDQPNQREHQPAWVIRQADEVVEENWMLFQDLLMG